MHARRSSPDAPGTEEAYLSSLAWIFVVAIQLAHLDS
jgi:hypothetical protein